MSNGINWGEIYCKILTKGGFGDHGWSANAIDDISAPACWGTGFLALTSDTNLYKADSNLITSDITQI